VSVHVKLLLDYKFKCIDNELTLHQKLLWSVCNYQKIKAKICLYYCFQNIYIKKFFYNRCLQWQLHQCVSNVVFITALKSD